MLLLAPLAGAQTNELDDATRITLTPPLPNYLATTNLPSPVPLQGYRMTTGDLNADGVDDLVFSNGVAFLRIYFLMNGAGGVPQVYDSRTILSYDQSNPNQCSSTGAGARFLTVQATGVDTALIYDIDLDGVNELVYLEHAVNGSHGGKGEIRLRVYQVDPATNNVTLDAHAPTADLIPLLDANASPPQKYFADTCTSSGGLGGFNMRIVNLRGRAFPQDILVWAHDPPDGENFRVYSYTAKPTPTLTQLFNHATWNYWQPDILHKWDGHAGHVWGSLDIDYDGKEELIGKHVITWDPVAGIKKVLWAIILKNNFALPSAPHQGGDPHPDHVSGLDFIQSYLDPSGKVVPSPGMEILVAPHVKGTTNACDNSGPMIYRAITGHMDPGAQPVAWPRKLLNINSSSEGARYWFPSSNPVSDVLGWSQPSASSHWNDLGQAFIESTINTTDPNSQGLLPCDIAYDPVNGVDQKPGAEMLVLSKGNFETECLDGQAHFVFDSTSALTAIGWDEATTTLDGPTIRGVFPVDVQGDRNGIEVVSINAVCGGPPTPASTAIYRWDKNPNGGAVESFLPKLIYAVHPITGTDSSGGTTGCDVMGDRREEVLFWRNFDNTVPNEPWWHQSEVVVVRDLQSASFSEPTPSAFLDYRLRANPQAFDYKSFSGLRFRNRNVMPGKANQTYGVVQDKAMVRLLPAAKQTGFVILAEGSTGPYTFDIVSGVLPAGLGYVDHRNNLLCPADAGAMLIHGTPIEVTTKRLEIRVTDGLNNTLTQSFWITVNPAGMGFAQPSSVPRITSGGFGSTFLARNDPTQNVVVTAQVDDVNDDVSAVKLYNESHQLVTTLSQVPGTNTWSATFQPPSLGSGSSVRYTMEAEDAATNKSVPWPYLVIDGGPGKENPAFLPTSNSGQTAAQTPRITKVTMPNHTIPAAEISDGTGSQPITVHVDRMGMTVTKITVRVLHHLTGGDIDRYKLEYLPPNGTLDQYTLSPAFQPPASQFGWGYYTVNVQVSVTNASSTYVSDLWPQLTAH